LLEGFLGSLVAGIAIRVVLHRATAISLLEFVVAGVLGNTEDFVVIALGHKAVQSAATRLFSRPLGDLERFGPVSLRFDRTGQQPQQRSDPRSRFFESQIPESPA